MAKPPTLLPAANSYQTRTSPEKLRGRFYTPPDLVAMMFDALPLASGSIVIDPACGDGSFLCGAVIALSRTLDPARPSTARAWARRIIGFDRDAGAVAAARLALQQAFRDYCRLDVAADELPVYQRDVLSQRSLAGILRSAGLPPPAAAERVNIVGNPPYVEAKRLPSEIKQALRKLYPFAGEGAPDLYLYFLNLCLGWLRPGDTMAFVLPNKLLVNANARAVREQLLETGHLRELWFATQAQIFPGAAVYPIVLFAAGASEASPRLAQLRRVTRRDGNVLARGEPLGLNTDCYRQTSSRAFFPLPEEPILRTALERLLLRIERRRLEEILDIRWSVSFHRSGLRERYVTREQPASRHARRFLGGGAFHGNGEVARYRIEWAGWWIDYDEDRLRAERNGVPAGELFDRPKIVICQNGRSLRAAIDEDGLVLKDTFLCGVIRERDHALCRNPRAIVGLLCSKAVHFFYSHVFYGGHVNGGYLHFLRSFLVDVPTGEWTDPLAVEVAALVRQRELDAPMCEQAALEERIESAVCAAFGLSPTEQAAIAAWAGQDANWQGRDRIRRPAR